MKRRPAFVKHVSELASGPMVWAWTGSDEVLSVRTPLSRPLGLTRLGVHHDVLEPGHRSSLPHAESYEEECIYVLAGRPKAWIDGELHQLAPDDTVVFVPGTGVRHTIVNDGDTDVRLLVIGERLDPAHKALAQLTEVWSTHDVTSVDTLFTDDGELGDVARGTVSTGREAVKEALAAIFTAFPDCVLELQAAVVSVTHAASEWVLRGTHAGAWAGVAPSGRPFSLRGASITELRNGQISRHTNYYDLQGFLGQLGT